tara:strand:- start:252 stop:647 length:396 start_codon:yes stop_codon:yes gene_type:complete
MAEEQLVTSEIEEGMRLVRALDDGGFPVKAALWLYSGDAQRWRFVIATTNLPKDISARIRQAVDIAAAWRAKHPGEALLDLARVSFVGEYDKLITGLGSVLRVEGLSQIRFTNNMVNGFFVEDALIHRLAA